MDTKGGKAAGWGVGGVMNWEIGIDMYTLICIKWITNKNLLYKKNIIKFKNSKKKEMFIYISQILPGSHLYLQRIGFGAKCHIVKMCVCMCTPVCLCVTYHSFTM